MFTSTKVLVVVAILAFMGSTSLFAAGESAPAAPASTNTVLKQATCPVMGGAVNKNLFVDYEGKRIYVCCGMCIDKVKKEPAKYVKQLEDQGITLDKAAPTQDKKTTVPAAEGHEGHQH